MRKLILFIASSLDGYIAGKLGEVDWLFDDQDYGYSDFYATIDTVLMGRKTYDQTLSFGEYPYRETQGFVLSKTHRDKREQYVEFIADEPIQFIEELKNKIGQNIWLVGGSEIIQLCLQHHLIDEFVLSIHPIILGEGIPLFVSPYSLQNLSFQSCKTYPTGLVQLTYKKIND